MRKIIEANREDQRLFRNPNDVLTSERNNVANECKTPWMAMSRT